MHELLFHRQKALENGDLRGYAAQLGPDVAAFGRTGPAAWWRAGSAGMSTAAWPRAGCVHAADDMVGQRGQRTSHEVAPIPVPPGSDDGMTRCVQPSFMSGGSVPGDRWRFGWFGGGGEQVSCRQAAAGSPFLDDGRNLQLTGRWSS